jgi:hypothetical protein
MFNRWSSLKSELATGDGKRECVGGSGGAGGGGGAVLRFSPPRPPPPRPRRRRPFLASECTNLSDAERWRRDVIREITKKVADIQNGAPREGRGGGGAAVGAGGSCVCGPLVADQPASACCVVSLPARWACVAPSSRISRPVRVAWCRFQPAGRVRVASRPLRACASSAPAPRRLGACVSRAPAPRRLRACVSRVLPRRPHATATVCLASVPPLPAATRSSPPPHTPSVGRRSWAGGAAHPGPERRD